MFRNNDKILHCHYYNRCTDKTQVFSLIRNDDVPRGCLHIPPLTDHTAGITDDYLIDRHRCPFPDSPLKVEYRGYFDEM